MMRLETFLHLFVNINIKNVRSLMIFFYLCLFFFYFLVSLLLHLSISHFSQPFSPNSLPSLSFALLLVFLSISPYRSLTPYVCRVSPLPLFSLPSLSLFLSVSVTSPSITSLNKYPTSNTPPVDIHLTFYTALNILRRAIIRV